MINECFHGRDRLYGVQSAIEFVWRVWDCYGVGIVEGTRLRRRAENVEDTEREHLVDHC